MTMKNFYSVRPNELEPGDVLTCTVALHVTYIGGFRVYRCAYPPQLGEDGVPQGSKVYSNLEELAQALFPVVLDANLKPEV